MAAGWLMMCHQPRFVIGTFVVSYLILSVKWWWWWWGGVTSAGRVFWFLAWSRDASSRVVS